MTYDNDVYLHNNAVARKNFDPFFTVSAKKYDFCSSPAPLTVQPFQCGAERRESLLGVILATRVNVAHCPVQGYTLGLRR